jgi:hypothetical protein
MGNVRRTAVTLRTADGTNEQGVIVDAEEAGVWFQTVGLHEVMDRAGVEHTFEDAGPGGHTWARFSHGLKQAIGPLNAHFAANDRRVPTSFSHGWARERLDMFDYRVTSDRGFLEFATLMLPRGASRCRGAASSPSLRPPCTDRGCPTG